MSKMMVVTGGASGIGAATVARLRAKDCVVHVLDVAPPMRDDVAWTHCDLGDAASIDAAIAHLPAEIDGLCNVAGVAATRPPARAIAINCLGLRKLSEALLPRVRQGGSIVNVASTAGRDWNKREDDVRPLLATTDMHTGIAWLRDHESLWLPNPYKFSKQCAAAYTYLLTGLAAARGVRVNCVNPGATETQLTPAFRELVGVPLYDWGVAQIGRHGTPDEIAAVIEWLAIGDCRWLNGVEIVVDGGYIAGIVGGWIRPEDAPAS